MFSRLLTRAMASASAVLCVVLASACSQFHAHRIVPMPAGALAVAPLDAGRVAVLAGDENSKGIFVVDLASGAVFKSFGTTKEATGLVAEGGNGPLLVSVGGVARGKAFGAVERWGIDGSKQRVTPLSSPALGITRDIGGVSYVLLAGDRDARVAVPISDERLRVGRPIPLDAGARTLQQCTIGASDYLVYTDGDGAVVVTGLENKTTLKSSQQADGPECSGDGRVYAISKGFAARSITVLGLPSLQQVGTIAVSNDASALYATQDHVIMTLDATPRTAGLEMVPELGSVKTASI